MSLSRSLTRFLARLAYGTSVDYYSPRVFPRLEISVTVCTKSLPELPEEVWALILRFATEYDKATFHPFDFTPKSDVEVEPDPESSMVQPPTAVSFLNYPHSHTYFDMRLKAYFSMMRFKLQLSLVSKQWFKLAQESLYNSIWINRPIQASILATLLASPNTSPFPELKDRARFIKRLHIETRIMERCSPDDLQTIVDHASCLVAYTDFRSVRRSVYFNTSASSTVPSSSMELYDALVHSTSSLRHLSWTNYDDPELHLRLPTMLSRGSIADTLEFLELTFCTSSSDMRKSFLQQQSSRPSSSTSPVLPSFALAKLRSIKLTLDDATFGLLASWSLPSLENVCVISSDFTYAGEGFCHFFRNHGVKIAQLELGHTNSIIDEHYLTDTSLQAGGSKNIRLAEWCPNLLYFICSADAEWNWENPNWIAPHPLLPSHPNVLVVGIRDIDKRLKDEMFIPPNNIHDHPFFMLFSQMETMMQRESFPRLKFIRDLSYTSEVMRHTACSQDILDFWVRVLDLCRQSNVYFEDYKGRNMNHRDIDRAEARQIVRRELAERAEYQARQRRRPMNRLRQLVPKAN